MKFTTPEYKLTVVIEVEGQEIEVGLDYVAGYRPGKYWGAPEDCYEDESDLEITGHKILDPLPEGVTEEDVALALGEKHEWLEEQCWQDFMERRNECRAQTRSNRLGWEY